MSEALSLSTDRRTRSVSPSLVLRESSATVRVSKFGPPLSLTSGVGRSNQSIRRFVRASDCARVWTPATMISISPMT